MEAIITFPAKIIATIAWIIFGFLVWIPLIIRVMITQSMLLFLSAITGERVGYEKEKLQQTLRFYHSRFRDIWDDDGRITFSQAIEDDSRNKKGNEKSNEKVDKKEEPSFGVFVIGLVWTIAFWAGIYFFTWA